MEFRRDEGRKTVKSWGNVFNEIWGGDSSTIITGSNNSSVIINGRVINGNNQEVRNVKVNGVTVIEDFPKEVRIIIEAVNVDRIEVNGGMSADFPQTSKVGKVSTMSADVNCGNVDGDVSTQSGDVTCGAISGDVSTMSGDVKADLIQGKAKTMSGDIKYVKAS